MFFLLKQKETLPRRMREGKKTCGVGALNVFLIETKRNPGPASDAGGEENLRMFSLFERFV